MTVAVELRELGGDGRPVVLGHGLTLDRRSLGSLGAALIATGHRVVTWELPGHGDGPPVPAWSVEALGAALAAAVREAPLDRPVLVGVSMGGYAALEAVGGPARLEVAALVLIGCAGGPVPAADPTRLGDLSAWAASGVLPPATASAMAAAELGHDHPEAAALAHGWRSDPAAGRRFLPGYLALFTRPDPAAAAAAVPVPSLLVRGSEDPWVAGDDAHLLARLLGAELLEVAGASHQPQHTHTAAVVDGISVLRSARRQIGVSTSSGHAPGEETRRKHGKAILSSEQRSDLPRC